MAGVIALQNFLLAIDTFWRESWVMAVIKFFALVYVLVLMADIVMLLMMSDLRASLRENLRGANRPTGKPLKYIKRWESILSRLSSDNVSQYKVAILEADAFAEDILEQFGYKGANMKERLERMNDYSFETRGDLLAGHAIRNRVIQEAHFEPTKEETEAALRYFSNFFKEADIF